MVLKQIFDTDSSTYSYILVSNEGNAIIIDPVTKDLEKYKNIFQELDVTLIFSVETHTHADHISGSGVLNEIYGSKILSSLDKMDSRAHRIQDGEMIELDEIQIKCLHTPGHTDDSYCFILESENPNILFSGDTLLIGGTGRSDFQNGCSSSLYESITKKLFTLDDKTLVYPGHDYNGLTLSSIAHEKNYNPRLANKSKKEFIEIMTNLNLSYPKMIDKAVPLNKNFGMPDKD
ncbi:MBL fold metallo-hydrolase [Gammaproteobacteria bacterium]|jgi:glyoxylase-like metal-dependent hydrolase (beta-lactamase superfamily II)|nr:MBL fold metallo-hydrolase [Gammaproteobacteria bacterium]